MGKTGCFPPRQAKSKQKEGNNEDQNINEINKTKTMKSTNQTQFLKKSNKKILPCSQTDQEKKRDKAQIAKIRNERIVLLILQRKSQRKLYAKKLDNLEEWTNSQKDTNYQR